MRTKHIIYIIGVTTVLLSSCHDDFSVESFLNGTDKTAITVVTNLQVSRPVTRAVDKDFEADDLLNAYIKHVTVADAAASPLVWSADVTGTGVGPRLANFKVTSLTDGHKDEADNWRDHTATSTLTVTDAQGLYWDDFSNSALAATDLRTEGHALMVHYGYGYNGGTATTALTPATGVLGWTVAADQTAGFKSSDLLYAGTQEPVIYAHGNNNTITGRNRVLTIPYTHAMSKVTVEVICDEGFAEDATKNFGSAGVTLRQAARAAEVTGPGKTVSKGTSPADINMQKLTPEAKRCSFSALIAPTVIKRDDTFAKILGVDGNNYDITLSDAAIDAKKDDGVTTKANAWSTQLAAYDASAVTPNTEKGYVPADGGLTKPGVHYMLTVTIRKQQIKVEATIQDWTAVSATGIGQILFDNDVADRTGDIAAELQANGFDLYKSETTTFGAKATTVSYADGKWKYSPEIYWQNKDDKEYFRALSGAVADKPATTDVNESLAMTQGRDVLWGTTPAHSGIDVNGQAYNYAKSAQIAPRTGNVPLDFEHAMSKISVNLLTVSGATAVDLTGAKIDIINTYNEGKIDINTGDISDYNLNLTPPAVYTLSGTVNADKKLQDQIVVPQSLVQDKDGAARTSAPTFYQSGELTKIYSDGTSIPAGGGTGTYYQTSTLDRVDYTDVTAADHNAALPGAVTTSDVKTPAVLYTYDEYKALPGNEDVTEDTFNNLSEADKTKTHAANYTADEAKAHNAALPGAVSAGDFHYFQTNGSSEQHTPGELKSTGSKVMLYVTLNDGTRYSLELPQCKDTDDRLVEEWVRGEHYTYDITLSKEQITFRALVKNWEEKKGSGNATLDWD